jgi:HK97 family phage major capsid protein
MESLLGELLGERMGRTANTALTTGTGSSAVEGIVTGSALGVTAAAVAAVTGDEILDLIHSVDPAYRASPNTAIMMNDSTLKAVRKLKDGDGNYLWQMGNFQAGVPNSLLGYNVVINQAIDDMAATKKVMLFGDMSKYYVRKVGAPSLYVARERFAPDFGILGYVRFDGVVVNSAAIKHLKNAAS